MVSCAPIEGVSDNDDVMAITADDNMDLFHRVHVCTPLLCLLEQPLHPIDSRYYTKIADPILGPPGIRMLLCFRGLAG